MKNLEAFDITIEEFDNMNEMHIFSSSYNENKKKLLKEYKKHTFVPSGFAKVAAVFAFLFVASPMIANAATHGELFNRIWGTFGRSDIASHNEVVYDEVKGDIIVTYPERNYEDIDVEKVEKLIGKQISYPGITQNIDGTTLTVLFAVRDKNAGVVAFTLEKEGGVDALYYSQLANESKGAQISDQSTFWLHFGDAGENIFVDLDNSTANKLYCYNYITLDSSSNSIPLEIGIYPCSRGEYLAMTDEELAKSENQKEVVTIDIPISEKVESVTYANTAGGIVDISPLSMKIDMKTGLGLTEGEAYDPYNCYYVSINYKDGSNYVVNEHEAYGKHTCDNEIVNASYICGNLEDELTYVFNRLVDVAEIASITINDVTYSCN